MPRQQGVEVVGGQWAERDAVQPGVQRTRVEPERRVRVDRGPARREHPDPFGADPAYHVAQHPVRRAVEPSDVVHRDHQWPLRGQHAHHSKRRDADGVGVGDGPGIGGAQQRGVEGSALRRRQIGGRPASTSSSRSRSPTNGRSASPSTAVAASTRWPRAAAASRAAPERGLADAGFALEQERGRRGRDRVDELRDVVERGVAPDESRPHPLASPPSAAEVPRRPADRVTGDPRRHERPHRRCRPRGTEHEPVEEPLPPGARERLTHG